ncbi:MAG: hypothetical protein IKA07_03255, partial [Alistipes sp.]|nr:hypothetical protein [Alistipes sp.]
PTDIMATNTFGHSHTPVPRQHRNEWINWRKQVSAANSRDTTGEQVELCKALINIYSITLEEYDLPKVRIRVECSKGTYIRSLAQEIGEKLDSGAYLTMLRRTRNGQFSEADAESLDDFLKKMPLDETKD